MVIETIWLIEKSLRVRNITIWLSGNDGLKLLRQIGEVHLEATELALRDGNETEAGANLYAAFVALKKAAHVGVVEKVLTLTFAYGFRDLGERYQRLLSVSLLLAKYNYDKNKPTLEYVETARWALDNIEKCEKDSRAAMKLPPDYRILQEHLAEQRAQFECTVQKLIR